MTNPPVKMRFSTHLRLQGGSVMAYDLLDEADKVIGAMVRSSITERKTKRRVNSETMTLKLDNGQTAEFNNREEFFAAYRRQLEERRRDSEWNEAKPKGES
jgi:hypothetical protein